MNSVTCLAIFEAVTLHPDPDFRTLLSKLITTISCHPDPSATPGAPLPTPITRLRLSG